MAKDKINTAIVTDANGEVVAEITKFRYVMIPVDPNVKRDLIRLCKLSGGSSRSQGAMVGKLVRDALKNYSKPK